MAKLNADARTMIESSGISKVGDTEGVPQSDSVQQDASAVLDSLRRDASTLSGLLFEYSKNNTQNRILQACNTIRLCSNKNQHVYITGIGKSSAVAMRLSVSLRSVNISSSFVHGSEFVHGDLGTLKPGDVVIMISNSGKTTELIDLASRCKGLGVTTIAITSNVSSALAKQSNIVFASPHAPETLEKIPSCSIIAQEAVSNMIVAQLVQETSFTPAQFALNHPGGAIGEAFRVV